jgi:thioredoxin 1
MSENVSAVTDATFDEVINASTEPVLVDFWAEWCGPCKMVAPILDEIADEQTGRIKITKLNVDENPNTSLKYQVQSIPTMLLFENGEVTKTIIGAKSKAALIEDLGL